MSATHRRLNHREERLAEAKGLSGNAGYAQRRIKKGLRLPGPGRAAITDAARHHVDIGAHDHGGVCPGRRMGSEGRGWFSIPKRSRSSIALLNCNLLADEHRRECPFLAHGCPTELLQPSRQESLGQPTLLGGH
jgi:hypothetical protein